MVMLEPGSERDVSSEPDSKRSALSSRPLQAPGQDTCFSKRSKPPSSSATSTYRSLLYRR